jgi:hypothetical protein
VHQWRLSRSGSFRVQWRSDVDGLCSGTAQVHPCSLDFFIPEKDGLSKDHQHRIFSSISSFFSKNILFYRIISTFGVRRIRGIFPGASFSGMKKSRLHGSTRAVPWKNSSNLLRWHGRDFKLKTYPDPGLKPFYNTLQGGTFDVSREKLINSGSPSRLKKHKWRLVFQSDPS